MTRGTYNSLPATLKVEKTREIKTVKLKDLGIEQAGHYSHDDKMTVLPEQVEKAKKFAKHFDASKNKKLKKISKLPISRQPR
jgi:hypothetical protein